MSGIERKARSEYLVKTTRSMLDRQMPPSQILATLEQENRSYCNPPLDRQELIYLIQSTQREVAQEEAFRATKRENNQ